jgi:serine/threonine-protein kinase SRPK3
MHKFENSSSSDETITSDSDDYIKETQNFAGVVLKNKYVIINKLGSGAFATVWLSYNIQTKHFNAIKIQNADDYDAGIDEISFFTSIKNSKCKYLNKLKDDFVYVDDFKEEHVCMVFELLTGSLYDIIKKGKYSNGFSLEVTKKIVYQLLLALENLNDQYGIIHTDIKPDNILLVGVSTKIKQIIDEFTEKNFDKVYKKYLGKKKKKSKSTAYNLAAKDIVQNMVTLQFDQDTDDTLSSEYNTFSSNDESFIDGRSETTSSSDETTLSDDQTCPVDEKFLDPKKIETKLSDFGGCIEKKNLCNDIQTRYYRSPEVLLCYKMNETCDVWSVGCVIYELLTGEILFEPDKKKGFSRDRHHLYDIQKFFGRIPEYLLNDAKKRNVFYKNNGLLKGIYTSEYIPFSKFIIEKLGDNADINEIYLLIDLLYKLFEYDPIKRLTAKQVINHNFFDTIRVQRKNK